MGHSRQEGGFAEAPQQPFEFDSSRPVAGALGPLRPEFQALERFMAAQQEIPADIFQGKVGREIDVLVDEIDQENDEAIAR